VRNAKRPIRGRKNLSWRQAFIKAYMARGERRKTGRNLSSGNTTRTGSRVSTWMQRIRTITRDTTRSSKNNESSTNARTTKNHQSSDPEQICGPAEKLTPSNPHLAADGDMKEAEGNSNNAMRPQQEEFLATDGDDEEKCEEQKALSHLG